MRLLINHSSEWLASADAFLVSSCDSAALSGGFIDRIVETKGLDVGDLCPVSTIPSQFLESVRSLTASSQLIQFIDREKAKHHAKQQSHQALAEQK